ncbi:hypothetical protein D9611_007376 [Ephemerocybe angulata]|uniref:Uncharacterized protein n=1 Tax=Ephemerocybe angulata TaxID=980116 RepID=A0A8H5CFX5_9AGAR|nr:hypothetical protein D9611_007376 [Tulosesus angulatus]
MDFTQHSVLRNAHRVRITALDFSLDGKTIASGDANGCVVLWDSETGREKGQTLIDAFEGEADAITSLAFDNQDHNALFVGCSSGRAFYQETTKGTSNEISMDALGAPIDGMAVGRCSRIAALALGVEVHILRPLLPGGWKSTANFRAPPTNDEEDLAVARGLHFCSYDSALIVSFLKQGIMCWSVETCQQIWAIHPPHAGALIGSSQLSPLGDMIATTNLSNGIDVYSTGTRSWMKSMPLDLDPARNKPLGIAFVKEGAGLLCGAHHGEVQIWDVKNGPVTQTLVHDDTLISVLAARVRGTDEFIATANDKTIIVWKMKDYHTVRRKVTAAWKKVKMQTSGRMPPDNQLAVWVLVLLVLLPQGALGTFFSIIVNFLLNLWTLRLVPFLYASKERPSQFVEDELDLQFKDASWGIGKEIEISPQLARSQSPSLSVETSTPSNPRGHWGTIAAKNEELIEKTLAVG